MLRRTMILMAVASVTLILAACGGGGGNGESGDGSEDVVVGYAGPTLNNQFFVGLSEGVQRGTEEYGFELRETNANGDAGQQFNQVTDLIQQGVDALVITPLDADGIVPAVEQANNADIPVFTLDRSANGGELASVVETDNVDAGQQAAQYIVDQLTERYGESRGRIANLQGLIGTTAARDREEGFQDVVSENPEIEIVANQPADFDQEKALNVTTNILQANEELDAIFGANDDNTIGAVRAIDSVGRYEPLDSDEHIIIVGIDGTAQALEAIRNGKQDATISQNPIRMAETALGFVNDLVVEDSEVPGTSFYPTILITQENIDSEEVREYGLWAEELE